MRTPICIQLQGPIQNLLNLNSPSALFVEAAGVALYGSLAFPGSSGPPGSSYLSEDFDKRDEATEDGTNIPEPNL